MSQLYTLNDVAQNTGENGMPCWIVVRDIVYDCTNYLDDVSNNVCSFDLTQIRAAIASNTSCHCIIVRMANFGAKCLGFNSGRDM